MDVPVLLLEFEGVVADTLAIRSDALSEALAVDGIALTDQQLRLARGHTTESAIARIREAVGAPDDATAIELCRLRAERAFAARAGKGISLTPGAKGALEKLGAATRLALVTRASRREGVGPHHEGDGDDDARCDDRKGRWPERLEVERDGASLGTYEAGKNFYRVEEQVSNEPAIRSDARTLGDLFLILDTANADGSIQLKAVVNPVVNLIWLAGLLFLGGALIAMWPDPREERRLLERYALAPA